MPVAATVNVAVCLTVTVWLAGCIVMNGATASASPANAAALRGAFASAASLRCRDTKTRADVFVLGNLTHVLSPCSGPTELGAAVVVPAPIGELHFPDNNAKCICHGNETNRSLRSVAFEAPPSNGVTWKISSIVRSVELWS